MDDLSDAVELLGSGSYTVTRRSPPSYSGGRRVPPPESTFEITASLQPLSGREVQRLPEGKRDREAMVLFTATELLVGTQQQEPDLVAIDGGTFEVDKVGRWAELGNYYRVVVLRKAGT